MQDPPQLSEPAGQAQVPALQAWSGVQATPAVAPSQAPDAPQWRLFVSGSTHCPPQKICPVAQGAQQAPWLQ
jgi:hypothetical protein